MANVSLFMVRARYGKRRHSRTGSEILRKMRGNRVKIPDDTVTVYRESFSGPLQRDL